MSVVLSDSETSATSSLPAAKNAASPPIASTSIVRGNCENATTCRSTSSGRVRNAARTSDSAARRIDDVIESLSSTTTTVDTRLLSSIRSTSHRQKTINANSAKRTIPLNILCHRRKSLNEYTIGKTKSGPTDNNAIQRG